MYIISKPILTIYFIFGLIATTIFAQENNRTCINFSDNIEQGIYGTANGLMPGDTLFTDKGVTISLQSFLYFDSTTDFINATISDDPIFSGDITDLIQDEYIFPSNINLLFDFRQVPRPVIEVCFNFIDGGGEENIAVNGQNIEVLNNLIEIDSAEIAPGVFASLTLSEAFDFPAGTLCLKGNIETLLIGGQEFVLDNVCFRMEDEEERECESIRDLEAWVVQCNPDSSFNLKIKFFSNSPETDSFLVRFRGDTLGYFKIGNVPIIIEDIPSNGGFDLDSVEVCLQTDTTGFDCCKTVSFMLPPNCFDDGDNDTCELGDIQIDDLECISENRYRVTIDFEHDGTGDRFKLTTLGGFQETYRYADLPIRIALPRTRDGHDWIKIYDKENPECFTKLEIELPCESEGDCNLSNGRIDGLECIAGNKYRVTINFAHDNTSERFRIKTLGGFEETYSYADLPIRIALPRTADGYDWIKIYDKENPECFIKIEVELPCESEDDNDCALSNARIDDLECIANNKYRVTINFDHDNTGETFKLKTSTGFQETYRYDALPIRIALPRTHNGQEEIKIFDNRNPNCYTKIEFELPCSMEDDTCSLSDIHLDNLECISDEKYRVTIDFDHGNTGDFFRLKTRGGFEGAFSYSQLPLRIALPITEDGVDEIKICDKQNDDCCTSIEFELPCGGNGNDDCNIRNLSAQPVDCDSNTFLLKISFDAAETSSLGYFIFVDGQIFGPFSFEETTQEVGPFFSDEGTIYDILILDIANPACYGYTEITGIDCSDENDSCSDIADLKVEVGECNSDSTFNLTLNFDYQGESVDSFFVSFRGDTLGHFAIDSLPISLENLRSIDEQDSESLKVCLQDTSDNACCQEIFFTLPNCSSVSEDTCRIFNLNAEPLECDSVGRFKVKLTFESEHGDSTGFKIFGNGEEYGVFSYDQDSIILGPFKGDSATVYEFIFQDLGNPDCKNEITIGPIACTVQIWPGDANDNNRADHFDLLNIGIAFGKRGPARSVPGNQWQGFEALAWELNFDNGVNYANADSNGDGVVNAGDKEAIELNYGQTNGAVQPITALPGNDLDPSIFVDLPDNSGLPEGLPFTVPVVLGSDDNFVEDIYGLAFTIEFDPTIIDPSSIEVEYLKSWLGDQNVNLITFDRVEQDSGRIHIAISRTNQTSVSGFGAIALISGIIDDIAGRISSEVEIKKVQAIKLNQERIPLRTPTQSFQLKSNRETDSKLDLRLAMRIIPNPAISEVQVYNRYNVPIHSLQLLDASGRPLGDLVRNTDRISLEGLPQGVYMLRIEIGEYIVYERVVKM